MQKNNIYLTIVSIGAIVAFLIGAYFLTNKPKEIVTHDSLKKVSDDDRIKWSDEGKHVLVEYSDLQCPACGAYHDFIKSEIESESSGEPKITENITFVYRHYPLPSHGNSEISAQAAEAAEKQGKFYEMIDLIFESQDKWSNEKNPEEFFTNLAKNLELDEEQFVSDMNSQEVKDKIEADKASGDLIGIRGTPSFFLDGEKIDVRSYDDFKEILLQAAQQ